jgi:hypothetical protein
VYMRDAVFAAENFDLPVSRAMQRHHREYGSELYSLCQVTHEKPEVVTTCDHFANTEFGKSLRVNATGDCTTQKIAECFDIHYATVSRTVKHNEGNV